MDEDSRKTIAYLRAQPHGGVVRWASDHLTAERPWATGWIDVRIPAGGPPGMNWVWTILDPQDPDQGDADQLWQFPWPCDLEAVRGWSAGAVCAALSDWAVSHARRDDLRFEWDREAADSPILQRIKERAAAGEPVWDLGGGLEVADGLMDELLELLTTDPEEAARVTVLLREAHRRVRGEDRYQERRPFGV